MKKNIFKLYKDKKSTLKINNRYTQGGESVIFEKRTGWWERDTYERRNDDIEFFIEKKHEFRADSISYAIYDTVKFDWLVLQYNNIVDINEELVAGNLILLPSKNRVLFEIATKPIKRT